MKSQLKLIEEKHFRRDVEKLLKANKILIHKLKKLMAEVAISPMDGMGYPEKLQGYGNRAVWSRRIIGKHRLVYEIRRDCVVFLSCYGHYGDH
jgi:toxin YoeB